MKINSSKTRDQFPLSTKVIIKKILPIYTFLIIIFLVSCLLFTLLALDTSAVLVILIILFSFLALAMLLIYLYQKWYFSVYFYDFTDDYIIIKKGPITPKEITIPYERVQDIYVDQDILDRIFGLYDVHLSSAAISSGMEAHIDGVEKQAADGLRAFLLQTVKEKMNKHKGSVATNNLKM